MTTKLNDTPSVKDACAQKQNEAGFLAQIQTEQPQLWLALQNAAREGLIVIDEASDAVTATNRLLLTYPGLHEILSTITNRWIETRAAKSNPLQALLGDKRS